MKIKGLEINNVNKIRLAINNDENRIIEFDPEDSMFINRYYEMMANFEIKQKEFIQKAAEIDKIEGKNSFGIKLSDIEGNKLMIELCQYMRGEIDRVFGAGTSEKAFGTVMRTSMITQFLSGIAEYVNEARNSKLSKYTSNNKGVMK